jgi:hypothetical protein
MLKKIYIKNGIILISKNNNMEINYKIINNYDKDKNNLIKEYYKTKGITY